ncbi:MAG: hypothetical protein JXR70_10330 [Spirochaetales bacterium]|nr:hypothetical protein [Spirochaetales bacterium]
MNGNKINLVSIRNIFLIMLPEMLGLAGIILYYQYGFKWMAVVALLGFMALFLFVSLVGRYIIFIIMSLVVFSIPIAIFMIRPWYMGFLIPFVIVYGFVVISTFLSHENRKKIPVSYHCEVENFEQNINN